MNAGWRPLSSIAILASLFAVGCGPNTFKVRGKVLHPFYAYDEDDTEAPRPPRRLAQTRKETRVRPEHAIVGNYAKPPALKLFMEAAQIVAWGGDGSMMRFNFHVCSNYKDEMDLRKYGFTLKTSEGLTVKGEIVNMWPIDNYTVKVSGMHSQPHLIVKDGRETRVYSHIEEVENEYEKYCREGRVEFRYQGLFGTATTYVIFTVDGYQRRWVYWYDFTWDPYEAVRTSNESEDLPR